MNTAPRKWSVMVRCDVQGRQVRSVRVKKAVEKILNALDSEIAVAGLSEVSITFTSDRAIQKLNREYRKKDKATDVLSFPQFTGEEITGKVRVPALPHTSLGDIVISIPTTMRQATEYGVSFEDELNRLLVHGLLHLVGYDHEKVSASVATRMRRKERVLRELLAEFE